MAMIRTLSTKGMSRPQWLAKRRQSIGGSDAAAIIGLSKWSSPYAIWAEKTGRLPDREDNEAMRQGRDLEGYVAQRWCEETGKKVRRLNSMIYNRRYPFAHADIDRAVVGEHAGLECKTTSTLDLKQFKTGEFPEKYYAQCVHYLAVTGWERWYLAVLVFGQGLYHFVLERDQAEIDALMAAEEAFWRLVEDDIPPTPDGTTATADALKVIYTESSEEDRDLFGREGMLKEYMQLKHQEKALQERATEIENTLKLDLQEAERGSCGEFMVSWKTQQRKSFQIKEFCKAYPDIDITPFYKVSTSRPFMVKETRTEI